MPANASNRDDNKVSLVTKRPAGSTDPSVRKQRVREFAKTGDIMEGRPPKMTSPRKIINAAGQVVDMKARPMLPLPLSSEDTQASVGKEVKASPPRESEPFDRSDPSHTQEPSSSTTFDDAEKKYFARSESTSVRNLKILVMFVLLFVAMAVCGAVYTLTDRGQQDEFEAR